MWRGDGSWGRARKLGRTKATGLFQAEMMMADIGRWGGPVKVLRRGQILVLEIWSFEVLMSHSIHLPWVYKIYAINKTNNGYLKGRRRGGKEGEEDTSAGSWRVGAFPFHL